LKGIGFANDLFLAQEDNYIAKIEIRVQRRRKFMLVFSTSLAFTSEKMESCSLPSICTQALKSVFFSDILNLLKVDSLPPFATLNLY
jgi:hypothetical protein